MHCGATIHQINDDKNISFPTQYKHLLTPHTPPYKGS